MDKDKKESLTYKNGCLHETFQEKPVFDIWGEKLSNNIEFFILPKKIGKITGAYSDLILGTEPINPSQKYRQILILIVMTTLFNTLVWLLSSHIFPVYIFSLISIIIIMKTMKLYQFKHKNLYFSNYGFAEYVCQDDRKNIIINEEVNFKDVTDLYIQYTENIVNGNYRSTDFIYIFLNIFKEDIIYTTKGKFNKEKNIKEQGIDIIFFRKVEHYWTLYLLNKIEETLKRDGYIIFNLYIHGKNEYEPYIKLSRGKITFLKDNNEEFTYNSYDIKKMYTKNNKLYILHTNFHKKMLVFKSGNEDIIPLLNLCNRQFFFYAVEILLGFKF